MDKTASQFSDVDRADNPAGLVQYLDTVTNQGGVLLYKRRSVELLRRAILNTHRETMVNPWMGRQLERLFRRAGLADVAVEIVTPQLRDLESASRALYLRAGAETAAASGAITEAQAAAFVRHLEAAAAAGDFAASMSVFVAAGRRA